MLSASIKVAGHKFKALPAGGLWMKNSGSWISLYCTANSQPTIILLFATIIMALGKQLSNALRITNPTL
jgi:hypothetical protein